MRRLAPYVEHRDGRGTFLGLTREGWAEVNFVETEAGETRGLHYHETTRELFFVISGEIDVSIRHLDTGESFEFHARGGDLFEVEPRELHTLRTATRSRWINMLSQPIDPENPDIHRAS